MTRTTIPTSGGAGAGAAVDQIGSDNYPMGKLVDGTTGGTEGIPGSTARGLLVDPRSEYAGTATLSNQTDQATNVQLLATNANRKGVIIHNDSTVALYVNYGATASSTAYTVKVPADTLWVMDYPIYTGQLNGIWASDASGSARITELT